MSVCEAYNFRGIDERVATSGLLSEEQLGQLHAEGYRAVINLLPYDSQYAVAAEPAIIAAQDLDYHHIPVDMAGPTAEDYAAFTEAMRACQRHKLLIHCAANYRVSAFYAIYAFEHLCWSASRAREHIASIWRPQEHPPWDQFVDARLPAGD
jgi:protein tyrosine phosphatase (PTP) superfamily phosphohydrolase (DUF442 family)